MFNVHSYECPGSKRKTSLVMLISSAWRASQWVTWPLLIRPSSIDLFWPLQRQTIPARLLRLTEVFQQHLAIQFHPGSLPPCPITITIISTRIITATVGVMALIIMDNHFLSSPLTLYRLPISLCLSIQLFFSAEMTLTRPMATSNTTINNPELCHHCVTLFSCCFEMQRCTLINKRCYLLILLPSYFRLEWWWRWWSFSQEGLGGWGATNWEFLVKT